MSVSVKKLCPSSALVMVFVTLCCTTFAQKDTFSNPKDTFFLAKKTGWLGKIAKTIAVNNEESGFNEAEKNVNPFLFFQNKTIGSVTVEQVDFGTPINDTSKTGKNLLIDIGNSIHIKTKKLVIQHNLFFKEGDAFSPLLVADNERFLRDLPYLQDARIFVTNDKLDSALVNVTILYKDVLPISGNVTANEKSVFGEIRNDNFMGWGDRLLLQNNYDLKRNPREGFGFEYLKRNIKGSFFNYTLGYTNINSAFNTGQRQESLWYTQIDLPLVNPYSLWTGAFQIANHYTHNNYSLTDSIYTNNVAYQYNAQDLWAGYNISNRNLMHENKYRKNKHFIAIRATNNHFGQIPTLYKQTYNFQYTNTTGILVSYVVFRQDYYHANFIYGFGRNEDIPEGFNMALIGGWTDKNNTSRPYAGIDLQKNYFSAQKSYYNFQLRAGSYLNQNKLQDAAILLSLESFTKLRHVGCKNWYMRHFLSGSITQIFNNSLNEPVRLNSQFGLPQFAGNDSIRASGRYSANCESVFYNTWKWLGFRFAPFAFGSATFIQNYMLPVTKGDLYSAWGAGLRTRNENLIFGTMECKVSYYPRTTLSMSPWNISINTNLRFKYNSQFIKRPEFVSVN